MSGSSFKDQTALATIHSLPYCPHTLLDSDFITTAPEKIHFKLKPRANRSSPTLSSTSSLKWLVLDKKRRKGNTSCITKCEDRRTTLNTNTLLQYQASLSLSNILRLRLRAVQSPLEMPEHLPLDSQGGNGTEVGSLKPPNKNRKTLNIPRPPNAWICYRSARVHELRNTVQYSKMPQASISKLVGELWRAESPEVKRKYENEAKVKKLEHQAKYPDYSFRPLRRDQPKKSSLKKSGSEPKKRPARLEELPSVLLPGPTTVPSGLPMPIPSSRALDSTSQYSSSLRSEGFHSSSTPSSFPSSPLYSPVLYSTHPIEGPPQALAPIETSQTWTMFQPNYLPTPPFDANPQPPSPPYYYLPFEQQEYITPGHCMTAFSTSSRSFDQNLPPQHELYSLPFVSPLSSSEYHLPQENWGVPEGEASPHAAELSYPNPFYPHS